MTLLSILDLAPVVQGSTPADTFRNTLDLARLAERLGYHRYWLAEHHNFPGIASSATSVVIGYVAAGTSRIRVGSGGIMLPNHAPLVIAEQFGTLESMYPGRIDLGLGRAPGTDHPASRALRRGQQQGGEDFPQLLEELRGYFSPAPGAPVHAHPGEGLNVPLWLLGSSGFSARLAGELGLPFAFASHFAPEYLLPALQLYRSSFRPSESLDKPYAMVAINVFAADTNEEAHRIATSHQLAFLNIIRGRSELLSPPVDSMEPYWTEQESQIVRSQLRYTVTGDADAVSEGVAAILAETQADELIVSGHIYDHAARLRSFEILADACGASQRLPEGGIE